MNDASGSALQKVSFVLVLFIAGAAGYLIVRERLRANQQRAEEEAAAAAKNNPPLAVVTKPSVPAAERPTYAPLRPRVETNIVRTVAVRTAQPAPANRSVVVIANPAPSETLSSTRVIAGAPAPAFGALAGSGTRSRSGVLTGRVVLRGTPPAEKPIPLDSACGRLNPAPITTRHYLVGQNGGLANVFIYVKSGIKTTGTRQEYVPTLDMEKCQFQPYVLGVRAGQPFRISNSEPIMENVHALPVNPGNREFNISMTTKGMVVERIFERPEVFVKMKSDVHPWMFAYIGVVDHPWFAYTDANGNFTLLPPLPPGSYTLSAVHPKAGESVQQVTVGDGESPEINFTLDVPDGLVKTP